MTPKFAYDVLGTGVVAVDDLLYVDAYPAPESKIHVRLRQRQCGGQAGTALVAAARLGARCGYVGMLGDDELSRTVVACFEREGIDLAHCIHRRDARPCHSTIIVDETHHTRTILASLGELVGLDSQEPPAEVIRATRVLLVDHHSLEGTRRVMRIAREAGVQVVADFERDPGPRFAELMTLADHLVLPRWFAQQWTDTSDPARAACQLWTTDRHAVVVTCGGDGCWCLDASNADRPTHSPAFSVDVVDTTGCGDVFHGAYAAGLAAGMDLRRRVILATATAALKATQRGGQTGIPSRQQVEAFLAAQR